MATRTPKPRPGGRPPLKATPRIHWIVSYFASAWIHVCVGSVVWIVAPLVFLWLWGTFGLIEDNPFALKRQATTAENEDAWDEVLVITPPRRPRIIPEMMKPRSDDSWVSLEIPFDEVAAEPKRPSEQEIPYRESSNVRPLRARGESLDFVSDKAFKGKGTFDTFSVGGGGGGRYGRKPGGKDAVFLALLWLARHQNPDGSWVGAAERCHRELPDGRTLGHASCAPGERARSAHAATGAALLAFIGGRYSLQSDEVWDGFAFREIIWNGVSWIVSAQDAEGAIGDRTAEDHLFSHSLAALALCEIYRTSGVRWMKRPRLEKLMEPAQNAVNYAMRAFQERWEAPYPGRDGRTWDLAWALRLALSAARAKLRVPRVALKESIRWDAQAMDMEPFYEPQRWNALEGNPHHWLFSAQAILEVGDLDPHVWQRYEQRIRTVLGDGQNRIEGHCREGSWEPGSTGGRLYTTALHVLLLESGPSYRYLIGTRGD